MKKSLIALLLASMTMVGCASSGSSGSNTPEFDGDPGFEFDPGYAPEIVDPEFGLDPDGVDPDFGVKPDQTDPDFEHVDPDFGHGPTDDVAISTPLDVTISINDRGAIVISSESMMHDIVTVYRFHDHENGSVTITDRDGVTVASGTKDDDGRIVVTTYLGRSIVIDSDGSLVMPDNGRPLLPGADIQGRDLIVQVDSGGYITFKSGDFSFSVQDYRIAWSPPYESTIYLYHAETGEKIAQADKNRDGSYTFQGRNGRKIIVDKDGNVKIHLQPGWPAKSEFQAKATKLSSEQKSQLKQLKHKMKQLNLKQVKR